MDLLKMCFCSPQLNVDKEEELSTLIAQMGKIYGSTKICPPNQTENCNSLEPELTDIMAESNNYEERTYYWKVFFLISAEQII